jgi:ATP-dependent RNA helicase DHX37/DHR1|tara:strand:- start:80 stop:3901 length:3822 start_codon:yes stop_codon:yes gene_type:complete
MSASTGAVLEKKKKKKKKDKKENEEEAPPLLSEELSGTVVLLNAKKKKKTKDSPLPVEKKLSKSQKRKLLKVEEDKRKRAGREAVLESLKKNTLKEEELYYFGKSSTLGNKETRKEKLTKQMKAERMGISGYLPGQKEDAERLTKRAKTANEKEVEESSEEEGQEEEDDNCLITKEEEEPIEELTEQEKVDLAAQGDVDIIEKSKIGTQTLDGATRALVSALREKYKLKEDAADELAMQPQQKSEYHEVFFGSAYAVPVERDEKIQQQRLQLPILGEEHEIMHAINTNPITVICGQTGCGKTTQVPQFLYEAGYGDPDCLDHPGAVCVTQPRRVAVTSTAKRIAEELNVELGGDIGYQVRHDKRVGDTPRIKFCTDGILLREIQADLLLRKYSVIIVDEAHERSVNTDILLGLLSRIVPLRAALTKEKNNKNVITPLRLVVMSATLRIEEFVKNKRLCAIPPVVMNVAARQFPVTIHFSRRTEMVDYVSEALRKTLAIHRKLPPGDILVFLTGQKEVEDFCKRLRRNYPLKKKEKKKKKKESSHRITTKQGNEDEDEVEDEDYEDDDDEEEVEEGNEDDVIGDAYDVDAADAAGEVLNNFNEDTFQDDFDDDERSDVSEEDEVVVMGDVLTEEETKIAEVDWARKYAPTANLEVTADETVGKKKEEDGNENNDGEDDDGPGPLNVLPLYAMLPPQAQARVFAKTPKGYKRNVIVSTNVAETSLTIPGVRYVVDAGRQKERKYERTSGMSRFEVGWISKASAEQRAGRAGRTAPGHCYRLFSSAHYVNDLDEFAAPAITTAPVDGVVLSMRYLGIDKVLNFPFITPPDFEQVRSATRTLEILGATNQMGELSDIGRAMAQIPVSPRQARMLIAASVSGIKNCMVYAIAMCAGLGMDSPFLKHVEANDSEEKNEEEKKPSVPPPHIKFHHVNSDALTVMQCLLAYDQFVQANGPSKAYMFCQENRLHERTMREMSDLRKQLLRILFRIGLIDEDELAQKISLSKLVIKPNSDLDKALRKALCCGWIDKVARRSKQKELEQYARDAEIRGENIDSMSRSSKALRYKPAFDSLSNGSGVDNNRPVFLHPSSALHKTASEFIVYNDLIQTQKRPYVVGATRVEPSWLLQSDCLLEGMDRVLDDPIPRYAPNRDQVVCWVAPRFGPHLWELPLKALDVTELEKAVGPFATALLLGNVFECFAEIKDKYAAKPILCSRIEGRSQPRVQNLLYALKKKGVCTKEKLMREFVRNRDYLRKEISAWLKAGKSHTLDNIWGKWK